MISVIIPVYNAAEYINDCCAALVNQTYKNIEIIFVNDGSADNSGSMLDNLKSTDHRITVVHKTNGGVSSARNAGIEICKGKYIMFCDADDIPESTWCEELRSAIETYPDRLPMCGIVYLPTEGEPEYRKLPEDSSVTDKYRLFELDGLITMSYSYIVYGPVNKIYRTDIIKQNNLRFDTNNSLGEDAVFNMEYLYYLGGKTVYVDKILYSYQGDNPNSLCKVNYQAYAESYEKIYNAYIELFQKLGAINTKNTSALHAYHYNEILTTALSAVRDNKLSKKQRMIEFKRFLYLPAFDKCRKYASQNHVGDIKLLKYAKFRPFMILYIWYMEIL